MPATTIAAIATPPGRGGIGITRISGPDTPRIAYALLGSLPAPRVARYAIFRDRHGHAVDQGIALYFPAPASFTGEDVLELQGHGGPVVAGLVLQAALDAGAHLARPGEFSERAFLNGKIDLPQAEAIADLINSESQAAARCALRSLQGEFSAKIHKLVAELTHLRCYVEAGIDFPDEEIDVLADGQVRQRLMELRAQLDTVLQQAGQGHLLQEGMNLVIIGAPNVGKSSLLNRLTGEDTAIVAEVPGTTRDLIRARIHLDGMPVHVTDTAGLRATDDPVEQEGIRRARAALAQADCALLLVEDSALVPIPPSLLAEAPPGAAGLVVRNKCDQTGHAAGFIEPSPAPYPCLRVSAQTGAGLELLRAWLKQRMGYHGAGEGVIMARSRHLDALRRALAAVDAALQHTQFHHGELIAEELRAAQHSLGEITGQVTSEDLLAEIFTSFCIGK